MALSSGHLRPFLDLGPSRNPSFFKEMHENPRKMQWNLSQRGLETRGNNLKRHEMHKRT